MRNYAEVVRLIESGADVNREWPVRPGLLNNNRQGPLTPVAVAELTEDETSLRILVERGARAADADAPR